MPVDLDYIERTSFKGSGIGLIVIAFLFIIFYGVELNIILHWENTVIFYHGFWAGIIYIAHGCLLISIRNKPTRCKIVCAQILSCFPVLVLGASFYFAFSTYAHCPESKSNDTDQLQLDNLSLKDTRIFLQSFQDTMEKPDPCAGYFILEVILDILSFSAIITTCCCVKYPDIGRCCACRSTVEEGNVTETNAFSQPTTSRSNPLVLQSNNSVTPPTRRSSFVMAEWNRFPPSPPPSYRSRASISLPMYRDLPPSFSSPPPYCNLPSRESMSMSICFEDDDEVQKPPSDEFC